MKCPFCFTDGYTEVSLYRHQHSKGHWVNLFGNRRIRPSSSPREEDSGSENELPDIVEQFDEILASEYQESSSSLEPTLSASTSISSTLSIGSSSSDSLNQSPAPSSSEQSTPSSSQQVSPIEADIIPIGVISAYDFIVFFIISILGSRAARGALRRAATASPEPARQTAWNPERIRRRRGACGGSG